MGNLNKWLVGITGLLVIMVFASGLIIGKGSRPALSAENETYEELKVFTEILSLIQKNYVEEVSAKDLIYGAIRGMLGGLDPHSVFMTPEVYREVQVDTKGEFGGLGIQIGIKNDRLTVIAPIEDTPAFRAGIQAGDWITGVNDEPTKDMTLLDAVHRMRGPRGTKVTLAIQREGVEEPLVFTLTRELIRIQSVKSRMLDDTIGYVRIIQFQERTGKDLAQAMKKLRESNMRSLILDLRNNPGGLLSTALEVSEQFLPKGKAIVYTKGRDGKRDEHRSSGKVKAGTYPMILLTNEGSASASEIVAGALQDWGRAVILGTKTFGKGSVQTILPLSDSSGVRLTTARYYTPKGRSIHNTGIQPDIVVHQPSAANLPPPIREKDLERGGHTPIEEGRKPIEKEPLGEGVPEEEDLQLKKAIELLKTWRIFKGLQVAQEAGSALEPD